MSIYELINIRECIKEDLPFILNSATQSLSKYTESIVKGQTKDIAYQYIEKIILSGLNHNTYTIFIACLAEDSNNIVGYIVADPEDNHIFIQYTKYLYRTRGIQKNFLLPLVVDMTEPITVNWPTKEMLKLVSQGKANIQNKFIESLIERLL